MPVELKCRECGKAFSVPPNRAATATTCSRECKFIALSKAYRSEWVTKTCPECDGAYICPARDAARRKFCSEPCKANSESKRWAVAEPRERKLSRHRDGYLYEYAPTHPATDSRGYVFQHRLVMERWLSETGAMPHFMETIDGALRLRRSIEVHHRNEKRDDNDRSNLVACTAAAHRAIHRGDPVGVNEAWPLDGLLVDEVKRRIDLACFHCGAKFARTPSVVIRGHRTFCSRRCYDNSNNASGLPARVETECAACGKTYLVWRSRFLTGTSRFCSKPCRYAAASSASSNPKEN